MNYFKWFIKSSLCQHEWQYHHTVTGDMINHVPGRTCEYCPKCESMRYVKARNKQ